VVVVKDGTLWDILGHLRCSGMGGARLARGSTTPGDAEKQRTKETKGRWSACRYGKRKSCSNLSLFVATHRGSTDGEESLRDAVGEFRSLKRALRMVGGDHSTDVFGWQRARLYLMGGGARR
jgi:hypothetical protein